MRISTFFLVIASLTFYAWGELRLMLVMVTTILVDYTSGLVISGGYKRGEIQSLPPHGPRTALQKAGIVCSIFSNLALLAFFKYFHFGLENYNLLMERLGFSSAAWNPILRVTASRHQFLHIRVHELHDRCLPGGS
jgi:alginate O-acetyltransferase complex protein AlgI